MKKFLFLLLITLLFACNNEELPIDGAGGQESPYVSDNGLLSDPDLDYLNGISTESPYIIQIQTKADQIMSNFLSALDNDTYRLSNVNTVIKDYISMVEKTSGLTNETKEILISSMIVATYSNELWKKYGVSEY